MEKKKKGENGGREKKKGEKGVGVENSVGNRKDTLMTKTSEHYCY